MWPETILLVHNRYREPGGEDAVVDAEAALLESRGHRVVRYELHNDAAETMAPLRLGARTVWSREAHRELAELVGSDAPDVVHFHNTFPLISPSAYYAVNESGAAVVQTLHNFRLICPQGQLLRDGEPCEDCVGRTPPWPGVLHGCYRGSRAASAAAAAMLTTHRALGTWDRRVDAYIALSSFSRAKLLEGGLPADRLHVKPNFLHPDPGPGEHGGGFLLFVGRLVPEKGVESLLQAWRALEAPADGKAPRLVIVGDGPLAPLVRAAAAKLPGLEWLGRQPRERVLELMGDARALVFPSLTYENCPGVIVEAYARGLPVIGSRLGSTAEMVREGATGALFEAGSVRDLGLAMTGALRPEADLEGFGRKARESYEEVYTADRSYRELMRIYEAASS